MPSMANDSSTETPGPSFGNLFDTIRHADLEKAASDFKDIAAILNPVTVASFNWIRASRPTIVIPGEKRVLAFQTEKLIISRQSASLESPKRVNAASRRSG